MAKVLSSISGNLISAASAGYAPTNGTDVSAIASAYQVVSATGTQLYASTAYVTSVNSAPLSASRAGNAANASMATSAYYDGTGRLISSLPDSTTVSSIASGYAASAASSKQDSSAMSAYALSADVSGCIDTVSANSATWGTQVVTSLSGNANFYNQINSKSISSTVSYKAQLDENGNSISALYNTVSAQSANWGGSALALSAGPGIVFNKVGDTLVASADETVLWTGAINTTAQTAAFSEATNNFERVRVYIQAYGTTDQSTETHDLSLVYRTSNNNDAIAYVQGVERHSNVTTQSTMYIHFTGAYGLGAKLENGSKWVGSSYTEGVSSYPFKLVKVVGVNRIAGA